MTVTSESLAASVASISPAMLALAGCVLAALILLVIVLFLRAAGLRREQAEEADLRARESAMRMAELLKIQAEMQGPHHRHGRGLRRAAKRTQSVDQPTPRWHVAAHELDDHRADQIDA